MTGNGQEPKILMISANRETIPYAVAPLGIAYLASVMREAGYKIKVLDLCFKKNMEKAVEKTIREFKPSIIGISVRNIDNLQYRRSVSYIPFLKSVIDMCRGSTDAPLVLGGTGFSMMPLEIMEYCNVRFGIIGDGEYTFVEFVKRMQEGENPEGIPGLICGTGGENNPNTRAHDVKPHIVGNLDSLPAPSRNHFDNGKYEKWGGMGNIQSKRGCKSGCIYCTYPLIEGNAVRCRSPKNVVDEMEFLEKKQGAAYVYFVDSVFNYPIDHALEICKEITGRKLKLRWSCYINPAHVTRELISAMKKAHCAGVEVGTDTASDKMLKNMRKGFTKREIRQCSDMCREQGLDFCHFLLLGGPGEDRHTLDETVDLMDEINPTSVIASTGIRLYPRTKLFEIASAEGMIIGDGFSTDLLRPKFYISPLLEGEELINIIEEYAADRPYWVLPSTDKNMPNKTVNWILRSLNIRGPLWRLLKLKKFLFS